MIAAAALLLGLFAPPPPQDDLACKLRHRVVEIDSLDKMPKAFALRPGMAPRGGYYVMGDVGGGPFARFVRGGHYGGIWYVWYEHGGEASGKAIEFLTLDRGLKPVTVARRDYLGQNPCQMTDALLDSLAADHRSLRRNDAVL